MNTQENQADSLHEIIFQNRNKEYGAYVIRNAYGDTVTKSLLVTLSLVSTFILGTVLYNKMAPEQVPDIPETPQLIYCPMDLTPKIETPKVQAQPPAAPAARVAAQAPPVITDDTPETNSPLPEETSSSTTTANPTGDGSTPGNSPVGNVEIPTAPAAPVEPPIEVWVDQMPEFIGGTTQLKRFLASNIFYPEKARLLGVEGTVYINFVVNEDGSVDRIKLLKGIGAGCDDEAIRVVGKMPRWKPGKNAGKAVKVMFNLPIRFDLE